MPRRKKEEDYCDECGYPLDECECEEEEEGITVDDVNKVLDVANKGVDFLTKLQKINAPSSTTPQPQTWKPITDTLESSRVKPETVKKEDSESKKKEDRKWKIETAIKISGIAISAIVALIVASHYFH